MNGDFLDWLGPISGPDLERLCIRLLEARGWTIVESPTSPGRTDRGIDIIADDPQGARYVVEVKATRRPPPLDPLYRLAAQRKLRGAQRALLVVSHSVTPTLAEQAEALEIEVWGVHELSRLLDEHREVHTEFLLARDDQRPQRPGELKVRSIIVSGFRGVETLELDLPERGATVLAGINGAGKSTVLAAVATGLSWMLTRLINPDGRGRAIPDHDINNGLPTCTIELFTSVDGAPVQWSVTGSRAGTPHKPRSELDGLNKAVRSVLVDIERVPDRPLPIAVIYTVNRAVLDIPKRIRKRHEFGRFSAFEEALKIGGKAEFRTFFEWFREREDLENEHRLRRPEHADAQLTAVRTAIETLLENVSNLRVRRNPQRMIVDKGDEELIVDQLSDGEKCLLATVGDLARRLAIANPSSSAPLHEHGVILIDEIDLHLHPRWQRRVVSRLQQTFPNCQFILTTHSPQVLSQVQEDAILLGRGERGLTVKDRRSVYGWDTNRILEEFLEVDERPPEVKHKLDGYFRDIQIGALEAAEQTRQELESELGPDEPSFKKADVLMRHRRRLLGE